jgi:hypothetical protein
MTGMPTVETLEELTELAQRHAGLFVRWSRGPAADVAGTSSDDLTGVRLPGLSASPLAVSHGGATGRYGCGLPGACMTTAT